MNSKTAYLAMYDFLERYYDLTKDDAIGGLLGSMSLLEDDTTADAAMWGEWLESVRRVQDGDVDGLLRFVKVE